jgi:hypothetical protein
MEGLGSGANNDPIGNYSSNDEQWWMNGDSNDGMEGLGSGANNDPIGNYSSDNEPASAMPKMKKRPPAGNSANAAALPYNLNAL